MKQKTIRVFEIDDFDKLRNVVESKYELVKNYYFMLKEPNKEIQEYLKSKDLNYFVLNSNENFNVKQVVKVIEKEIKEVEKVDDIKIFDKIIRNGEEIEVNNGVFLKKINPGAKVKVYNKAFILDENRGEVIVEGNFLFVRKNSGNIVYNSEEIGEIKKDTVFYGDKRLEL